MEANQKKKFVCKFCDKKFPCGKSLGGHIRIHLNGNSTGVDDEDKLHNISKSFASNNGSNSRRDSVPEAGGQSGYGLRENPKKTMKFLSDTSNNDLRQEYVCKDCDKGFQSLKALCGHMACHSKNSFEGHSGTSEKLKELFVDSQSDTETSAPSKRRRSERMRYKAIGVNYASLSSASDIEQEQEEVALCLMMLSRDSGFKGCFSSVADSSDNNSVVLEAKSSSTKMRISVKNGINCALNGNDVLEMKKAKQGEVRPIENDHSENSDSGYFMNGPKNVESNISVHGFTRNVEFNKHKVKFGSRFDEDFDGESRKRLSRFRRVKIESGKKLIQQDGYDRAERTSMKCDSKKRGRNDSNNPEFVISNTQRSGKCFSLGENRTSHKKTNGCRDLIYESGENSIDADYVRSTRPSNSGVSQSCNGKIQIERNLSGNAEKKLGSKKGKVHECPFCYRVFRSGQALGGHKRSHFIGVGEDRTLVIKQEVPEISMPSLIDLNLPAPVEEEANGLVQW